MLSWLLALALLAPAGFAEAWRAARDPHTAPADAAAALQPFTQVDDAETRGRAWFALGELAERRGDPQAAVAAYGHSLAADAGGRFAARAAARQGALSARLGPDQALSVEFDRVRRDYLRLGRPAARAAVAALLEQAQTRPLQTELRLWQAEDAFAGGEVPAALAGALAAAEWPAAPPLLVRRAIELALRAAGPTELDRVQATLTALAERRPDLAAAIDLPALADDVLDRQQRRVARWVALGALLGFLLAVLRAGPWRHWRAWRPWKGLLFLTWAFGGAALLAERFDGGYGWIVGAAGAATVPVYLASSLAGAGGRRPWVALLAVPATLGAMFLVLDRLGQAALMGM
ncbi:MAG: hypothetical protein H6702_22250 [Myxococcales bacterium]|nr:hypothetical protein [Myxococcales bacterium]